MMIFDIKSIKSIRKIHSFLLLAVIIFAAVTFTFSTRVNAGDGSVVTNLDATATSSQIDISGTTYSDSVVAVMVEVLKANESIAFYSYEVTNSTFSGSITGLSLNAGDKLTVRAANYDGGGWKTIEISVPKQDTDQDHNQDDVPEQDTDQDNEQDSNSDGNKNSSSKSSDDSSESAVTSIGRSYNAIENTAGEKWNKAYISDANNSHGNLGNHYKATAPVCVSNSKITGWELIKKDINSKDDKILAAYAYEVNMNTATRVDNECLNALSNKNLPYARFKLENNTTFVIPTNIFKKNTETFSAIANNKAKFYLDITCNTTNDVYNKVIDTQFIPFNLIKSVKGDASSRMVIVRSNNKDLTNIGAVKLFKVNKNKTKVKLYLYDAAKKLLKPCGTVNYNKNGYAVVYVSLANWNLLVVEE